MNALDYVLQRPAPAEKFPQKRFGDRLFISAEAGPDWMRTNANLTGASLSDAGYRMGLTIGDWITPVHGWRLGISGGRHHGVKDTRPFFAGLSLDYMMNLSALLRKDNPSRRFELIGMNGSSRARHFTATDIVCGVPAERESDCNQDSMSHHPPIST